MRKQGKNRKPELQMPVERSNDEVLLGELLSTFPGLKMVSHFHRKFFCILIFLMASFPMDASVILKKEEHFIAPPLQELASSFDLESLVENTIKHEGVMRHTEREWQHGMICLSSGYFANVTTFVTAMEDEKLNQIINVSWGLGSIQIEANPYLDFHLTVDAKSGEKSSSDFFALLPLLLESCCFDDSHISADKSLSQSFLHGARCSKSMRTSIRSSSQKQDLVFPPLGLVGLNDEQEHFTDIMNWMDHGGSSLPFILIVFLVMGMIGYISYQKPY